MYRAAFLFIKLLPVILFCNTFLAWDARADRISFNGDIIYQNVDSKTTNKLTGQKIDSTTERIDQRYNLDLSKTIYPYLSFRAGGIFESNRLTTESEGTKTKTKETLLQPLVEIRLDNPIYLGSLKYRRSEIHRDTTDLPDTEDINDQYTALLGWRPLDLPDIVMRYTYNHFYDDPETTDFTDKLLTLESKYTWRQLGFNYSYTRTETENRLTNFDTKDQTHFGRVEYTHNFWDGRLAFNTAYRINYGIFEFSGASSAEAPLLRFQGLFSLDNTPEDGPELGVNDALVDGDLEASSGINLGTNGDELTLTNIGVDLGSPVPVNSIRLWVDQRLSSTVADSFSWSVYSSPDNADTSTWTLVATVSPAPFGVFQNRFDISFPGVVTRFIKVVTRPLADSVPDASSFPDIFVTEMETFGTVTTSGGQNKTKSIDTTYDLNLTGQVTDQTVLGYNLRYNYRDQDPGSNNRRTELENEMYLNHVFNKIFSTTARLSRLDSEQFDIKTVRYAYSFLVKGSYLPTFGQTLSLSGTSENLEDDSSDNYSLILRNNAILYRGWSAFVDVGYNWDRPALSDIKEKSLLFRAGTNFEPNPKLTFNLNYRQREILKPERNTRYEGTLEVFFLPVRTLSFNARLSMVNQTGSNTQTTQNYTASWSPFPDGALQFSFAYSETIVSEEDRRDTTIGPRLDWTFAEHFLLNASYSWQESDTNTQKIESKNFFSEFRFVF